MTTMLETLRRHLDAEAAHDAAVAASTYAEDGYYENAGLGLRFEGRTMVEFQYAGSFEIIKDMKATYQWEYVGDDLVVQHGRITGVAAEEMFGVPSRGGVLDFPFTAVITFRDNVMLGEHVFFDLELFCAQARLEVAAVRDALEALRSSMGHAAV